MLLILILVFYIILRSTISTLFPYTTLFRSLLRHGSDKTLQVGYANHFYRSAHKFEQICRHRLRRQNVGYSNFSQPQSHLSFCVLLRSEERFSRNAETELVCRLLLEKKKMTMRS